VAVSRTWWVAHPLTHIHETQECPDNLDEVGPRFMEAGPRYGITFFPDA
jgi:hypothetical protein